MLSHKYAFAAFPKDFIWGVATAAHQVEGGNTLSDWYHWENLHGSPEKSGLACDFWHRYSSDFDLATDIGMNSYRLSVEWSRVEPNPGEFDQSAIDTYRQMLESAHSKGLKTMVTLHHFTSPQWLAATGGWLSPRSPKYFKAYTDRIVLELGSLVDLWITINEPNVVVMSGYAAGVSPPGLQDPKLTILAYANLIEAHAYAYQSIHAMYPHAKVGFAHHMRVFEPARKLNPFDKLLARWVSAFWNKQILEAIDTGKIDLHFGPLYRLKRKVEGLQGSLDFLGVNYYSRDKIRFNPSQKTFFSIDAVPAERSNDLGWEIYPEGLGRVIRSVQKYDWPIIVTENGIADSTDSKRPKFICDHLQVLERVIEEGAPVLGYYHWSIYDNFEWSLGYAPKFGLYSVDYATQVRTARPSATLYRDIVLAGTTEGICQPLSE